MKHTHRYTHRGRRCNIRTDRRSSRELVSMNPPCPPGKSPHYQEATLAKGHADYLLAICHGGGARARGASLVLPPSPNTPSPSTSLRVCGACACEAGRVRGRVSWNELRMAVGGALRERALLTGRRRPIGCVHTRTRSVRPASKEPAATFLRSGHNTHTHKHARHVWIMYFFGF